MKKAFNIEVSGLVQGVGFRPFVYKLAKKHHLNGWVKNRNDCVEINVSGDSNELRLAKKIIIPVTKPIAQSATSAEYTHMYVVGLKLSSSSQRWERLNSSATK